MTSDKRAARLGVLAVVGMILFGALGARLWFLQTVESDALQAEVDSAHTETLLIAPERGQIFDADGRLVAGNDRVLNIVVSWEAIRRSADRSQIFQRLSGWVEVPVETMEARYDSNTYDPLRPLPIAEDVDEETVTAIMERNEDFPGVSVEVGYRRIYPYAPLASHVVGYMGAITAEDAAEYKAKGYDTSNRGEDVGRAGVELSYEDTLHGEWGKVVYEIDSHGRVVREIERTDPIPGNDVQLSVDLDVQQYAERLLSMRLRLQRAFLVENPIVEKPNGTRQRMSLTAGTYVHYPSPAGSVVVMNNSTGQVIAMASYPTFDNRWFNEGISEEKFNELFKHVIEGSNPPRDDPDQASLTNRAIQGQYNLGSTFKPFVAYAGIMSGLVDPNNYFRDTGTYKAESIPQWNCDNGVKCVWRNSWCSTLGRPCDYGMINTHLALAVSSDAYFYHIGEEMFLNGRTLLQDWVAQFGFGRDTGIDLPYEFSGRVPTDELKAQLVAAEVLAEGEEPRLLLGDVINMAIGQGLLAATPLQLAVAYSALANGGYVMQPRVVRAIYAPDTPVGPTPGTVDLSRAVLVEEFAPAGTPIEITADARDPIIGGLAQNITGPGANGRSTTAEELFDVGYGGGIPIAGKTGTAQGFASYPWNDSSVFAAFSLDSARPYTVVAYMEKSGFGSRAAGSVVKCMFLALGDPASLDPVGVSEPLDPEMTTAAEPTRDVSTDCMQSSTANTVFPGAGTGGRPPD